MEQQDKKISQMTQLTNISGDEIVPVVKSGGNYSTLVSQIVALARQTMVEAQAGKGLSANDFTDAFKAKLEGLSNYDDAEVRSLITAVNGRLDTILGDGASSAIDTFNEIEAFLTGITDTQTLTGLLAEQKQTITSETDAKLAGKVDKVAGKGLSTNDYTDEDKAKLSALPTKAELDSSLGAKLDKSKWDEEHEQFTIKGYFLGNRGNINVAENESSGITPLLPLSKTYPIVLKNVLARGNAVALCFYDAAGSFISYPEGIENLNGDFTVSADKYPENACFFRVCTEKTGSSYSNGPSIESREGAVSEAIQASKLALFVDQWIHCYDCQYVPTKAKPFSCNGVELTYQEALDVYNAPRIAYPYFTGANQLAVSAKTLILSSRYAPGSNVNLKYAFYNGAYTVIRIASDVDTLWVSNSERAFGYCQQLEKILGAMRLETTNSKGIFFQCFKLQEVKINHLSFDISFHHSPLLSLASLTYLVTYAANTSTITVTVHPDVYAKLTDTTNAEWYAVTEAAAAKNIAFATTN